MKYIEQAAEAKQFKPNALPRGLVAKCPVA